MTEGGEVARRGKDALSLSGGHLCHACGHQYPNPNPSAKLRRSHRRNCSKRATPEATGEERSAGEARRVLGTNGGGGGLGDGEEPGNGAGSGANGGSASPGSAAEDKENAEHVSPNAAGIQVITSGCAETGLIKFTNNYFETADEGNGINLPRPYTNGIQHKVPKAFTEIAPTAVTHPVEREDSFDEYQDASSFLHQSDPEDGAAVALESDIPTEIKNLDTGSVGTSVAADVISVEMNGLCKDQYSSEPSMPDFPAGSKGENEAECYLGKITPAFVGHEDGLILQSKDECSADIGSNRTDVVVDSKSDKTSSYGEFIGDLNAPTLQKCSPLMSDPESQSACCWKEEDSFLKGGMDVLESMSDISRRAEIVGSDNIGSKTVSSSETNAVPTGDELNLIHTENTSADCSKEHSQNLSVQGRSDVQLPVDSNILVNSACAVPGYQNDLAVTNVDGTLKSIAEDNYSKDISVKGSGLDSSSEERPQQVVEQNVTVAEGNTSLENGNGFCTEEVCSQESDTEVPTKYQVSSSQEHVTLLMDQVSSIKNPFNLDDTRSEDLFELCSGSYHFEEQNVVESKQQTEPNVVSEGQQCLISGDPVLAVSNENGYAVGAEDMLVSSSADPSKNIFLHDASVNHNKQEGDSHTNGIICAPSDVSPTEFGTSPVSQEINALNTYAEEKIGTEDADAKDITAAETTDNFEEKKQIEDASAKELNAVLHTDNVEEGKLSEDNGVNEASVVRNMETVQENNQGEATSSKEVRAVQSTETIREKDQTEDSNAKKMDRDFNTDNVDSRQTDGTSKQEMYQVQHADHAEEKTPAEETSAKDTNTAQSTDNVEEQKPTEGTVGLEEKTQNKEIAAIGSRMNSARISVPLKVLLAEASLESKEKKPSTKERVLSFRRRPSSKDDASSAKPGSTISDDQYWNSPAKLPHGNNVDKRSKVRKQPWMPFICCHSVH